MGEKIVWAQELTKIPCGLGFLFQQQQSICFQLWDVCRIYSAEHNLVEYFSNGSDIINLLKSSAHGPCFTSFHNRTFTGISPPPKINCFPHWGSIFLNLGASVSVHSTSYRAFSIEVFFLQLGYFPYKKNLLMCRRR